MLKNHFNILKGTIPVSVIKIENKPENANKCIGQSCKKLLCFINMSPAIVLL